MRGNSNDKGSDMFVLSCHSNFFSCNFSGTWTYYSSMNILALAYEPPTHDFLNILLLKLGSVTSWNPLRLFTTFRTFIFLLLTSFTLCWGILGTWWYQRYYRRQRKHKINLCLQHLWNIFSLWRMSICLKYAQPLHNL